MALIAFLSVAVWACNYYNSVLQNVVIVHASFLELESRDHALFVFVSPVSTLAPGIC